jgi:hypothetical protein
MKEGDRLWYIAVNGSSCAMAGWPLRFPFQVRPIPEVLFGFATFEEASEAQRTCHNDPIPIVKEAMRRWIESDKVHVVSLRTSEPQTDGDTLWIQTPGGERDWIDSFEAN